MSRHCTPASASAARAATTPYSTKLRPHLPHGCMPTPATTTSLICAPPARPSRCCSDRLPLPHDVVVLIVAEQVLDDELDLLPDLEVVDAVAVGDLAEDDHLLVGELDARDRERREVSSSRDVGRRRLVLRVGEAPDPATAGERGLLELLAAARRVAAEERRLREEHRAARRAPVAQQRRLVAGGEPALDRRRARTPRGRF